MITIEEEELIQKEAKYFGYHWGMVNTLTGKYELWPASVVSRSRGLDFFSSRDGTVFVNCPDVAKSILDELAEHWGFRYYDTYILALLKLKKDILIETKRNEYIKKYLFFR